MNPPSRLWRLELFTLLSLITSLFIRVTQAHAANHHRRQSSATLSASTTTSTQSSNATSSVLTTSASSSTPIPLYNTTYTDSSPQIFYGTGDICSGTTCVANPWNPWLATSYTDSTNQLVTCHTITQARARQSDSIPYLAFQFAGTSVYLLTVTSPSSRPVFNASVDGGLNWQTVQLNATSSSYQSNVISWHKTGLANQSNTLLLRFWADAHGANSLDGVDSQGSQLNVQGFIVTGPQSAASLGNLTTSNSNASLGPSASSALQNASPTVALPADFYSDQKRTALIVGLSIGIPLLLILIVLVALLAICLRRDRQRGSMSDTLSPIDFARGKGRKHARHLEDYPEDADQSASGSQSTTNLTTSFAVPTFSQGPSNPDMVEAFGGARSTGVASARRARRRAAEAAAAAEGRLPRRTPASSNRGGSSGEQGGSESDGSSLYSEDKPNPAPRQKRSLHRAPSSSHQTEESSLSHIFFPKGGIVPKPPTLKSPRSYSSLPPLRVPPIPSPASRMADRSARVSPTAASTHRSFKDSTPGSAFPHGPNSADQHGPQSSASPHTGGPPTGDQDTTYRSFTLGPTPDMLGQSPLASTPDLLPPLYERRQVQPAAQPRPLTANSISPSGSRTKLGPDTGLVSPASTVEKKDGDHTPKTPPSGGLVESPYSETHLSPHSAHDVSRQRSPRRSAPSPSSSSRQGSNHSHPSPSPVPPLPNRI